MIFGKLSQATNSIPASHAGRGGKHPKLKKLIDRKTKVLMPQGLTIPRDSTIQLQNTKSITEYHSQLYFL
jgi:hypothetical protein